MTILNKEIISIAKESGFMTIVSPLGPYEDIDWSVYYSDCLENFHHKSKESAVIKIEGDQLKNLAEFFKRFENSVDNVKCIEISKEKISINLTI